jgi:hypothetical protein
MGKKSPFGFEGNRVGTHITSPLVFDLFDFEVPNFTNLQSCQKARRRNVDRIEPSSDRPWVKFDKILSAFTVCEYHANIGPNDVDKAGSLIIFFSEIGEILL